MPTTTLMMATASLRTEKRTAMPSRAEESGPSTLSTGRTADRRDLADPAPCYRKLQYCWSFPTCGESTNESTTSATAGATGGRFRWYWNLFTGYSGAMAPFFSCPCPCSAWILDQSMGARIRVGIGLSYRPPRLHRLAESFPWNQFMGFLKV